VLVIHRQRHRLPNHLPQPPQSPQFRPSSPVRSPFPAPKYISIAQWKASSPHSRPPSTPLNPHSRCCGVGCPIPRDFVPWRFSDACCCCAWNPSSCRRQRNLHINGPEQMQHVSACHVSCRHTERVAYSGMTAPMMLDRPMNGTAYVERMLVPTQELSAMQSATSQPAKCQLLRSRSL